MSPIQYAAMSLSISYTNSHASHTHPGSTLRGTVHFSTSKEEAFGKVIITFSGRCKVKIREHLHYTTRTFRSRGYYFHLTQALFDGGGFTHKAGEYAWPFEFQVPEVAQPQWEVDAPAPKGVKGRRVLDHNGIMQVVPLDDESGKYDDFPPKSPWRVSKDLRPHLLPESFKVAEEKNRVVWEGRVEYALIAKVERPAGGSKIFNLGQGGNAEVALDVPLKTKVDDAAKTILKDRQTFTFERWVGRDDKKGKGIRRALSKLPRRSTESEKTVSSEWRLLLTIETARALQPLSTLPFIVKATATLPTFSVPSSCLLWASATAPSQFTPTANQKTSPAHAGLAVLSITDLTISLQRKTSVRDDSMAATEHTAAKLDRDVLCWRRDQRGVDVVTAPVLVISCEGDINKRDSSVTMQGEVDLEDLIHTPLLTPSFSTYNIAVEYSLEFDITVNCFNTTVTLSSMDCEAGNLRMVVLPASSSVDEEGEKALAASQSTDKGELGMTRVQQSTAGVQISKEAEAALDKPFRQDPEDEEELPAYKP